MIKKINILLIFLFVNISTLNAEGINWHHWEESAFKKAKKENKLILINVGLEGCTACNRMTKYTYNDPSVIKIINDNFISIEVDSQARPDIGERYSDWAWPATVFLLPDTSQIFAMAGNKFPKNFIPILEDLIEKKKNNTLQIDADEPYLVIEKPLVTDLTKIRDKVIEKLDSQFNHHVNGWNTWGVNAEVDGPRLKHLYALAHRFDNKEILNSALKVSETFLKTLDPVWGGAYEANIHKDAKDVPEEFAVLRAIPEKRISSQANALAAFATAYEITKEKKYIKGIENVDKFLTLWMLSPEGTWYANQKDTAPFLPDDWWPQKYWGLKTDAERRKYGIPPIDHAIYTDKTAEIILAYIEVSQALNKKSYLEKAINATNSILHSRQSSEGWLLQFSRNEKLAKDKRIRALKDESIPFLITQVRFGKSLLALYQVTAEKKWLIAAKKIANATLKKLYDNKNGGFWASSPLKGFKSISPRKPLEQNAVAGQFFYDLYVLTKNSKYKDIAKGIIPAVVSDEILRREGKVVGETALFLDKLTNHYVEFTIVTNDSKNTKSQELYKIGLSSYHPRKIIHFEEPGRYPLIDDGVMFICNPNRCSTPLKNEEDIKYVLKQYL